MHRALMLGGGGGSSDGGVVAVAGADDVTVALERLEDELQSGAAHVEAVPLPDC